MGQLLIKKTVLKYWESLIGDKSAFSHESRLFHSFSAITLMIAVAMIFLNLALNLLASLYVVLAVIFVHSIAFYISRIKKNLKVAIIIAGIESNLFLGINYFFNSGIEGPSLVLFIATLLLMTSLMHNQDLKAWVIVNICTVLSISLIEYFKPDSILYDYRNAQDKYIDILFTYVLVVLLISYCIYYIRKNHETQKAELEEKALSLKKLNDEKDKIFSIISHDLRSPLASLQQYLDFISNDSIKEEDRKRLEKRLIKNTTETQELLTNILHWSKSQLNGINVKSKKHNLNALLVNTIDIFKNHCHQKHIQAEIIIEDRICILADENMLQLVLRNLLNNAVKFTKSGGKIVLKADLKDNTCIITVKDNGIGIPENRRKSIFTLKADSTFGTNHENGTGLSLMICKEYIDLQGGKIWFESDNSGTEFYVALPCQ